MKLIKEAGNFRPISGTQTLFLASDNPTEPPTPPGGEGYFAPSAMACWCIAIVPA